MKQILNSSLTKWILISLAIILSIVTISIGYSALNTTLNITGEVVTRVSADIRITSLETERLSDGAYNTYNSTFSKDETNMYTTLPENGSVAVYKITITNYSSNDYILSELITNKSNTDISCIIEGISEGDIIPANSEITFTIKMLYVEVGTDTIESINNVFSVKYVFEEYVPDSGGGATLNLNNYAATIKEEANIGYELVYKGLPVRPVFSIDSSVIYTGGTGTREDPMRLS